MLSAEGGVEIESVAESNPDAIAKIWVDPTEGLTEEACRAWVAAANLNPDATEGAVDILGKLYTAYVEGDADLVEINPLILKPTGEVHALDAKVSLDGNAVYEHPDYEQYEATQPRDEREEAAHEKGLQYVGLEGSVGIIANGAGLAMSTVDVVNQVGERPPTSSTSAAEPTPMSWPERSKSSTMTPTSSRSSSTSSAASPGVRRWPTASSRP